MGIEDLGVFVYPLALCMILSIFVVAERSYSLRKGTNLSEKGRKLCVQGNSLGRNGKSVLPQEVAWVATRETPSPDSLRSYCALEVSALEQGMFLLEVVIAGAFGGIARYGNWFGSGIFRYARIGIWTGVFSEGIAMALLTTIIGLAIAIPTLFAHSHLMRIIEKERHLFNGLPPACLMLL